MATKYNAHQIMEFLQQKKFPFYNERLIKQPEKNRQYVKHAFNFLAKDFHLPNMNQDLMLSQLDPQKHRDSAENIKNSLNVQNISQDYNLFNLFKPERERTLKILSSQMHAHKFKQKIQNKCFNIFREFIDIDEKQKQNNQLLNNKIMQDNELRIKKKQQYQEFLKIDAQIKALKGQIQYKKKQKREIQQHKKQFQNSLNTRKTQKQNYINQQKILKMNVQKIKRQIISNAPQLKLKKLQNSQRYNKAVYNKDIKNSCHNQKVSYRNFFIEALEDYDKKLNQDIYKEEQRENIYVKSLIVKQEHQQSFKENKIALNLIKNQISKVKQQGEILQIQNRTTNIIIKQKISTKAILQLKLKEAKNSLQFIEKQDRRFETLRQQYQITAQNQMANADKIQNDFYEKVKQLKNQKQNLKQWKKTTEQLAEQFNRSIQQFLQPINKQIQQNQ